MLIPESSLEPFGHDIPTFVAVRQGTDPALLIKVWSACYEAFRDAIRQWKIMNHCKKNGIPHHQTKLNAEILKMRAMFAGGKDVTCEIKEYEDFFYMCIEFEIEGDPSNYGSYLEYPDGENSNCEYF